MGYKKNEKIIITLSGGKNISKPGIKVPIEQKKPIAPKPATAEAVKHTISPNFNHKHALLLFLVVSDQKLLLDYIKTLDLKYYGQSPFNLSADDLGVRQ